MLGREREKVNVNILPRSRISINLLLINARIYNPSLFLVENRVPKTEKIDRKFRTKISTKNYSLRAILTFTLDHLNV